jgi:D-arabinose 1-dehydrogenase-like Zn-dependent alcohol dehydrogenase
MRKGQKVGIVGLGGLGHMGVKFVTAFGPHVADPSNLRANREIGGRYALIGRNKKPVSNGVAPGSPASTRITRIKGQASFRPMRKI